MIKLIYDKYDPNHIDIFLTRGDTLKLAVAAIQADGTEYVPESGDVIRFAMKKKYKDAEPIITQTVPHDTMILTVDSDDTASLRFGEYVYDIEITFDDDDDTVDTFLYGTLTLTEEVD